MIGWMQQAFVMSALLAAVVAAICMGRRVPPAARHALWLLVIVKLLMPPVVAWPWTIGGGATFSPVVAPVGVQGATMLAHLRYWLAMEDNAPTPPAGALVQPPPLAETSSAAAPAPHAASRTLAAQNGAPVLGPVAALMPLQPWRFTPSLLRRLILGISFAGAFGTLILQIIRILRMQALVRAASPAPDNLQREIHRLAMVTGLRPIAARVLPRLDGPYVWALPRPTLLWPADLPVDRTARGLIVHELVHVKRRDHWVGWLELAAGIVWWWNPIYYMARRNLRANAELCCDTEVGERLPSERQTYAKSLLAVCARVAGRRPPGVALGVKSAKRELAHRLVAIMAAPAHSRLSGMAWAGFVAVAAVVLPAFGQTNTPATSPAQLPFTLGRETTVITAPLRSNGTPDYVQAINDTHSKGVTPENNGFVLLLESFGGKGTEVLSPKYYDRTFRLTGAREPAEDHKFPTIWSYLENTPGMKPGGPDEQQAGDAFGRLADGPWSLEGQPGYVADFLKRADADLDIGLKIAARSKWWIPFTDAREMMPNLLPAMDIMSAMGETLCIRAMRRADAGQFDEALGDLLAARRLARHLSGGAMLIERLVGYRIERRANGSVAGWAAAGRLTSPQARKIQQASDALPALGNMAETMDECNRWTLLDNTIIAITGPGGFPAMFARYLPPADAQNRSGGANQAFARLDQAAVDWDVVLKQINHVSNDIVAIARVPAAAQRRDRYAAIEKLTQQWMGEFNGDRTFPRRADETREAYSERIAHTMIAFLQPAMPGVERFENETAITADLARVLLAAADARARTGAWPKTAAEVIGPMLAKMPRDIYSAQGTGAEALKYALTNGGPRVYSIGKNFSDDGGVRDSTRKMDDIALPNRLDAATTTKPLGDAKPTEHTDLANIKGDWKIRSVGGNGDFRWRMISIGEIIRIENVSLQLPDRNSSGAPHDYYVLSPNKVSKEFDVTFWLENLYQTQHGIYQLDGDTLTLSVAPYNQPERPKKFAAEVRKSTLIVLDRVATAQAPTAITAPAAAP